MRRRTFNSESRKMMKWTRGEEKPADWPLWLRGANISWCEVEVRDGIVTWFGGEWLTGLWLDGLWSGGIWRGGKWIDGIWNDGGATTRSRYIPVRLSDNRIQIGCKTKTREEWDEWFAGCEQYDTPRGTEAFARIEAHYRALCAYADYMSAFEAFEAVKENT